MSKRIANMPGPGGSQGMCGVCGKGFLLEILMGSKVQVIEVDGLDHDICIHTKCEKELHKAKKEGWEALPEGPLRRAYAKEVERQKEVKETEETEGVNDNANR